eukprot:355524-Chlamydomonas_euryale.AAC.45
MLARECMLSSSFSFIWHSDCVNVNDCARRDYICTFNKPRRHRGGRDSRMCVRVASLARVIGARLVRPRFSARLFCRTGWQAPAN